MSQIAHDTVFGRYIRRLRHERQLSQDIVAGRVGIPQEELSKWELGKVQRPAGPRIVTLAKALDIPVEHLALALVGVEPEEYTFPELAERPLTEEMRAILAANPSPAETRILLDLVRSIRREMETATAEAEGAPDASAQRASGG